MKKILKLSKHNEKKEIKFELNYLKSLSIKKRFEMMFKKTKEIVNLMERNGHKRPSGVFKRNIK